MTFTLAFDVYGTLINTHGVVSKLQQFLGGDEEQARAFSHTWRDKQLEYAFRRGLMQNYANFAVCTRDALAYTAKLSKVDLSEAQIEEVHSTGDLQIGAASFLMGCVVIEACLSHGDITGDLQVGASSFATGCVRDEVHIGECGVAGDVAGC